MICFLVGLGFILGVLLVLWLLGTLCIRLTDGRWDFDPDNAVGGLGVLAGLLVAGMIVFLIYTLGCGLLGHKLP